MYARCFFTDIFKILHSEGDLMKKVILSMSALCLAATLCSCSPQDTSSIGGTTSDSSGSIVNENSFDESNIVLTFAALSDIHQNGDSNSTAGKKFESALKQLADYDPDLICVAGDMTDGGSVSEITQFKNTYEQYSNSVPLFYALGNHDGQNGETAERFAQTFGADYFKSDLYDGYNTTGNRHIEFNGFHFVAVEPQSYYGGDRNCYYSDETKEWLSETLEDINTSTPDKPVFVFTHPMIYKTAYGSELPGSGTTWYTEELTSILEKYPQIVTFSGHVHHPLNDERSVMQTAFTSLGCGSVSYMAIEGGYIQTGSGTVPTDAQEFSQGLLVEVDSNGRIRFTRLDFYNESTIKSAWVIDAPAEDGSHLLKYSEDRAASNEAPVFDTASASVSVTASGNNYLGTLKFNAGQDNDLIHHYVFELYEEDTLIRTEKMLTDFYLKPQPSQMKKAYGYDIGTLKSGTEYSIVAYAVDSWGAASNKYEYTFTTDGEKQPQGPDGDSGEPYVSLEFSSNGVTDIKGHVSVTNNGTTLNDGSAVITAAGQNLMCEFNEFGTASDAADFLNNGFSVEAVFKNGQVSGTQGVVCSTQNGGWGIATSDSGEIYFIVSNGSYVSVYSQSRADELTHVVAVYDPFSRNASIYINGELKASAPVSGTLICGTGESYKRFFVGADISASGNGGDFMMSNFEVTAVRIYQNALTASDVASIAGQYDLQ